MGAEGVRATRNYSALRRSQTRRLVQRTYTSTNPWPHFGIQCKPHHCEHHAAEKTQQTNFGTYGTRKERETGLQDRQNATMLTGKMRHHTVACSRHSAQGTHVVARKVGDATNKITQHTGPTELQIHPTKADHRAGSDFGNDGCRGSETHPALLGQHLQGHSAQNKFQNQHINIRSISKLQAAVTKILGRVMCCAEVPRAARGWTRAQGSTGGRTTVPRHRPSWTLHRETSAGRWSSSKEHICQQTNTREAGALRIDAPQWDASVFRVLVGTTSRRSHAALSSDRTSFPKIQMPDSQSRPRSAGLALLKLLGRPPSGPHHGGTSLSHVGQFLSRRRRLCGGFVGFCWFPDRLTASGAGEEEQTTAPSILAESFLRTPDFHNFSGARWRQRSTQHRAQRAQIATRASPERSTFLILLTLKCALESGETL